MRGSVISEGLLSFKSLAATWSVADKRPHVCMSGGVNSKGAPALKSLVAVWEFTRKGSHLCMGRHVASESTEVHKGFGAVHNVAHKWTLYHPIYPILCSSYITLALFCSYDLQQSIHVTAGKERNWYRCV